jgi:hypothetical protein
LFTARNTHYLEKEILWHGIWLSQATRRLSECKEFGRWFDYLFLNFKEIRSSISRRPRTSDPKPV